jgi:hypothetical protein
MNDWAGSIDGSMDRLVSLDFGGCIVFWFFVVAWVLDLCELTHCFLLVVVVVVPIFFLFLLFFRFLPRRLLSLVHRPFNRRER